MSFVRAKEIPPGSGNWYDYEVMNVREGGKVIQKHIRYLGKHGSDHSALLGGTATPDIHSASVSVVPAPPKPHRIPKMKTEARRIASALGMYYGGMPLDAIQQQFRQDHDLDMSESNYWNWVRRFTKEAVRQARGFKPIVGNTWVADETYMKIKKRNVYFWDIIDSDTRYLLATHVSFTRGTKDAKALMELAAKRAGKAPKVVLTDKLAAYLDGVELAFGADSKHRQGGPFNVDNNTNLIERFHKTLEQRTRVFQKYDAIEDIRLLSDGWLINYNFMKQHEGAGNIPPAQRMSKVVPFRDWNDIVRDPKLPDVDYNVTLFRRQSVKRGPPVFDARLRPISTGG